MPTPAQPPAFSLESVDAQRVEDALALMGPKWTTWTVMTMLQEGRPLRVRDVAARLPFVSEQLVGKRLATMRTDGLVIRADTGHGAPYRLSALGESLTPVHRTLADWSRTYMSASATAEAERVEDAVQGLRLRHTTAMVQVLDKGGPMRSVHIAEQDGLDYAFTQRRLLRLQADGLVTRTDPRHGAPYALTDAGWALGPVYAAVDYWSTALPTRWTPPPPAPVAAAQRTHPGVPLGADSARTAAALRRSTAVPAPLFSHAPPAATAGAVLRDHPIHSGAVTVSRAVPRTAAPLHPAMVLARAPAPTRCARGPLPFSLRSWSSDHVPLFRPVPL